jgi:hypothetical protein
MGGSMSVRRLAALAAVWQLFAWGGRVSLLGEAGATNWDWIRIGTGVGLGVVLAFLAVWPEASLDFQEKVSSSYLLLTVVVWGRSVFTVWTEVNTLRFRSVHTALALVTFFLGVALVRAVKAARLASSETAAQDS